MKALVQTILNATAAGKSMLLAANAAAQKALLSLENVTNTSDANKPVSTAQQTAIDAKIGGSVGTTTNRLVKSSGTGGLTLQSTGLTVDASDNVTGVGTLTTSGQIQIGSTDRLQLLSSSSVPRIVAATSNIDRGEIGFNSTSTYMYHTSGQVTTRGTKLSSRNTANSDYANFECAALTAAGLMCAGIYTVGTLPSAAANAHKFASVSDSSVTTFGSTVSAGGSSKVLVHSNGTDWTVFAI